MFNQFQFEIVDRSYKNSIELNHVPLIDTLFVYDNDKLLKLCKDYVVEGRTVILNNKICNALDERRSLMTVAYKPVEK